jgi:hypothetical protein
MPGSSAQKPIVLDALQHSRQLGATRKVHTLLLSKIIQTRIVIAQNNGGGSTGNQLAISLFTGDNQHLFQWKPPTQSEKTDRFAAGCAQRQHI